MFLNDLMAASGLNGNALSEAIGVKPTSLSGWRHGRDLPDGGNMAKVIEVLRGKVSEADVRSLLRAWMELRLGAMAKFAWEDSTGTPVTDPVRPTLDELLWRWTPAERADMSYLIEACEKDLRVREAVVAISRCLPGSPALSEK